MKIPLHYIARNLWTRRITTILTVTGVALVVFVFAAVLMMAHGIQKTLVDTGSEENVIVLRKAATAEITSIVMRDQANIVRALPLIARKADGGLLASGEIAAVINMEYSKRGGFTNITVRGLPPEGIFLRPQVKLTEGRLFQWGTREIVVGASVHGRFRGATPGEKIKFGGDSWMIVGVFDAGGSGFDSEIWGDVDQLAQAFGYEGGYSSILMRLERPGVFEEFKAFFGKEQRLQVLDVKPERQFYAEQSEDMASFIRILGVAVTVIFSLGAMIGAMITMYAAVSNRTTEIGTLRAIGFPRRSVLAAFLLEALFIAFLGGGTGLLLALPLQFFKVSMMNFGSFSELAFSFALSPRIVGWSLLFAFLMGIFGGFLPSVRAARLHIVTSLRGS